MNKNLQKESWIVCLSTFPPRQCGIATFTTDLTNGIERVFGPTVKTKIVAMNLSDISRLKYPDKVILQISQPREKDYIDAALKLNLIPEVKLVPLSIIILKKYGKTTSRISIFKFNAGID